MTKTKMRADTMARKTKIRGRVAEGLQVSITINLLYALTLFTFQNTNSSMMMMMMVPAEEDGPGSDEKDEELESEGDQHPVAGHVALQVLESQTKHSQLKY